MGKNNFDIKGFEKMLNDTKNKMVKDALNGSYDYECPECKTSFKVSVGKNVCPNCELVVNLKPDDTWNNF